MEPGREKRGDRPRGEPKGEVPGNAGEPGGIVRSGPAKQKQENRHELWGGIPCAEPAQMKNRQLLPQWMWLGMGARPRHATNHGDSRKARMRQDQVRIKEGPRDEFEN